MCDPQILNEKLLAVKERFRIFDAAEVKLNNEGTELRERSRAIERELEDKAGQVHALEARLELLEETPFEKIQTYMRAKWLCDGCRPVDTQDVEEGGLDSLLEQVVSKLREEFRGNLSGQLQVVHEEIDDLKLKRAAVDAEMERARRECAALALEMTLLNEAVSDLYQTRDKLAQESTAAMHDGGSAAPQELASAGPKPTKAVAEAEEEVDDEAAPLEQGREAVAADVAGATSILRRGEALVQDGVKSSETPSAHEERKKKKKKQPTKTTSTSSVAERRGKKQQGKRAKCRARL